MGLHTLGFFGAMPLGALMTGAIAARVGDPLTVGASPAVHHPHVNRYV